MEILAMALVLTSPTFANNGEIPKQYTCEGTDVSPPLQWSGAPAEAKSFVLIIDDPDAPDPRAPKMTWVHWVVYNIPADVQQLPEDAGKHGLPTGGQLGVNDFKRTAYGGPCPPIGRHRYFHKLYALDQVLPKLSRPTKAELLAAMDRHVIAEAQLIGTYKKGG
jgi:Raf kinase inhibitor-like YbhB/YbcL family protein